MSRARIGHQRAGEGVEVSWSHLPLLFVPTLGLTKSDPSNLVFSLVMVIYSTQCSLGLTFNPCCCSGLSPAGSNSSQEDQTKSPHSAFHNLQLSCQLSGLPVVFFGYLTSCQDELVWCLPCFLPLSANQASPLPSVSSLPPRPSPMRK